VLLAQVKGSVRDRLRRTGLMAEIGEDRVYLSVGSAVTDFLRRWPAEAPAAAPDGGAGAEGAAGPPTEPEAPTVEASSGPDASSGPEESPAPDGGPPPDEQAPGS